MAGVTLARRLERLEAAHRGGNQARHDAAVRELGRTLSAEHRHLIRAWMREHVGHGRPIARPGESVAATCARLRPPALVRAAWLLVEARVRDGAPVSLAPAVAEVYLADPDAYPTTPCGGCRYLMPTRSSLRADGSFRHIVTYLGSCPVCGLDNHPEEDTTP